MIEVWKGKGDGLKKFRRRLEKVCFHGRKSSASVTCEILRYISTKSWKRKKKTIIRSKKIIGRSMKTKRCLLFLNRLLIKDKPSGEQKVVALQ